MRRAVLPTLTVLSAVGIVAGLVAALTSSPDAIQGDFVRILYVHVPSAWLAFLAFGITAAGSIGWLISRNDRWDRLASSSAEIGVLFTAAALVTGMLWGRPVWGTYWDWGDARMASTALMFFVYLGYLALRRATPDPDARARRSAIVGVIAVIQVPLVYFSVNLWRTLHQGMTVRPDGIAMDGSMVSALLVNVGTFTLLYITLLAARMRLALVAPAEPEVSSAAGTAVAKPNLGEVSS
jgi:heme exporter protein C